jgi:hypothetical protein
MQIFESGRGKISSHSTWTSFGSETAPGKERVLQDKTNPGVFRAQDERPLSCPTNSQRKESS